MLPAANVTARHCRSAAIRLAAVVALVVALLALCLARADAAAASLVDRAPASEKGVASAVENTRAQAEVERGHYKTLPAAAAEGKDDDGPAVPERELEVIEDYLPTGANNKHEPRHP